MWKTLAAALLFCVSGCQPLYSDPLPVSLQPEWKQSVLEKSEKVVVGRTPYPASAQIAGEPTIKAMYFPSLGKTKVFVDGRVTYQNIRGYQSQAFFSMQWDSPGNAMTTGTLAPTMANLDFTDAYLSPTGDLPPP